MNLKQCTPWSTGISDSPRSLEDIRDDLMAQLQSLEFCAFSYEGVPYRMREDINAPPASRLIKFRHIAKAKTALTSSPEELERLKHYHNCHASTDPGFKRTLQWEGPIIKTAKEDHAHLKNGLKGFRSVLVWPMKEFCPPQWGGLFALKSPLSPTELEEQLILMKPRMHHLLFMFHFELMSGYRRQFNPYLMLGIFSDNALTIIQQTARGKSSKEIANMLGMSERGVDYHIDQMRYKLGARNRLHLIHIANTMEIT